MPTYMDMHDIPGVKASDVAGAHEADVRVQGQYGVNYKQYWVDEENGKVFCLVDAPADGGRIPAYGLEATLPRWKRRTALAAGCSGSRRADRADQPVARQRCLGGVPKRCRPRIRPRSGRSVWTLPAAAAGLRGRSGRATTPVPGSQPPRRAQPGGRGAAAAWRPLCLLRGVRACHPTATRCAEVISQPFATLLDAEPGRVQEVAREQPRNRLGLHR